MIEWGQLVPKWLELVVLKLNDVCISVVTATTEIGNKKSKITH